MKQATNRERMEIACCITFEAKMEFWTRAGFSVPEAIAMVKGAGFNKPVWTVGNVPYAQAISKDHALNIHRWNFGETGAEARLIEIRNGTRWVIAC